MLRGVFAPIHLNCFNRVTNEKQVIVFKSPLEGNVGLLTIMGDLESAIEEAKICCCF